MKNDPIEAALERLDGPEPELAKALSAKSNLVVAKAARVAGDRHALHLLPQLTTAFHRMLKGGDKGCAASLAIARALVKLDHDDAELFLRGMKHIQREPVWGGSVDSAADLRAACAIGFTNGRHPNKLRHLLELLVDPEAVARSGAVRAIAAVGSESAALLLRYKALLGDPEADVLSDTLVSLIEVEGAEALPLAESLTRSDDEQVQAAAILALGASRRPDAVELLKQRYAETARPETRKCILLSLASARTEDALDFVLGLIRCGNLSESNGALDAVSLNRSDPRIRQAVDEALNDRERPSSRASKDPTS